MNDNLVELRNISLNYNEVKALDNTNITFKKSSIHALIGEHGAGKSSIGLILSGLQKPTSGEIIIKNKSYSYLKPKVALSHNIQFVHQQFLLNPYFSVAENLFYWDKKAPFFSLSLPKKIQEIAKEYLNSLGFDIDVTKITKNLTLSEKALLAILIKIKNNPKIIILDESLDKISVEYYSKLKKILSSLRSNGSSIIIMTHKIDRVYDIADKISIIRNGKNILTENIQSLGKMQIIKMAYTHFTETPISNTHEDSFYHLIKYNEAILENLPVNLIVLNNDGILKLINKYFLNNFKIDSTQYLEKNCELLLEKTIKTTKNIILNQVTKENENTIFHLSICINNIKGIYNIHYSPIYDNKQKIGAMVILYDITEYDSLQRDTQLSEKLSSVGLLSAGVAHEINNPLEIISNYLTNIKFRYNDPDLLKIVNKLTKQVNYITKIVSNLQNFSNLEKVAAENTNINELIKEMIDLLKLNAKLKNIKIVFTELSENNIAYINENELKQAILNILKNSFESIKQDGEIEIIINKIDIYGVSNIELQIKDTGKGIDESKDYFTPFFSTKSNNGTNTGLGLSLVYGIITKYEGTISINNRTDKKEGCVIKITFPIISELLTIDSNL
ncbi:MAG: ATP-binding cassette domain-containing protein [Sphaerochaetaceae bacterium]|nr:ATP-binding cassette domain-containing protein [Sphaerochaetaceae bacterium]